MEIVNMKRLLLLSVISASIIAQSVNSVALASGACGQALNVPDKLPGAQVSDFKSSPQELLKSNPLGGLQLSDEVKGLTLTDPVAAVDTLLDVARSANSTQAAAIGAGLGQAVKAILAVDKPCSDDIARRIASTGLSALLTGYNMAMSSTPTPLSSADSGGFSGGSGGGGGSGGVGGVVNGTSGLAAGATTSASGSTSDANTAETFSFSGASITCSSSVSPRRTC
jgi:hypothetical protein